MSTRTRYGFLAAIELAKQFGKGPLQLRVIAERQEMSMKYLEQLMAPLKASGLVKSIRGARGGYVLARAANEISVYDVFHCLEGEGLTVGCVGHANSCKRASDCAARHLWAEVDQAVDSVLISMNLEDLAHKSKVPGRQDYDI